MRESLRGLYVLTRPFTGGERALLEAVEQTLEGGARLVQYRDKGAGASRRRREAAALAELCGAYGVPVIVNDDPVLAAAVGAGGVHLGRDDAPIREARELLGPSAIIGASCYDRLERARQAARAGADYLAFGSFHPSPTKPGAVHADTTLLGAASGLGPALCAIGGITPENGAGLVAAGADLLAVISGVFDAGEPRLAASRYAALFDDPANPQGSHS